MDSVVVRCCTQKGAQRDEDRAGLAQGAALPPSRRDLPESLRYQPLTLTTLAALVPPELDAGTRTLIDEGHRGRDRSTSTPTWSA